MKYAKIKEAVFLERPNRFIARVMVEGREEIAHVKNTGRCKELLTPGATVYLEDFRDDKRQRKTLWDLVAVKKGQLFINMDSQAPNKVTAEALLSGALRLPEFPHPISNVKAEAVFGESRLDFCVEAQESTDAKRRRAYIEVKGVTLEENGIARFPDAPTERGIKHIRELCRAREEGLDAYLLFIVQMKGIRRVEPNDETHQAFGDALREAKDKGVILLAYDCDVNVDSLCLGQQIPVVL